MGLLAWAWARSLNGPHWATCRSWTVATSSQAPPDVARDVEGWCTARCCACASAASTSWWPGRRPWRSNSAAPTSLTSAPANPNPAEMTCMVFAATGDDDGAREFDRGGCAGGDAGGQNLNVGDIVPALRWLDLQGVVAKMKKLHCRPVRRHDELDHC